MKIFINVRLTGTLFIDFNFIVKSYDASARNFQIKFEKSNGKKQYDGTSIFTIDVNKYECHESIIVEISFGRKYIILNSLTVEFEESFYTLDYNLYKKTISNLLSY